MIQELGPKRDKAPVPFTRPLAFLSFLPPLPTPSLADAPGNVGSAVSQ